MNINAISPLSLADGLLRMVEAEEMRRSLKQFVMGAWSTVEPSPYVDGWAVDAICEHLEALTSGQIRFLLINIPPRHSKSTICSVLWPVWCWLQKPEDRFLCASYSLDLAIRDNLKKRNLIESPWFRERYGQSFTIVADTTSFQTQHDFALSEHQNAKRFFTNDRLGYQLATSVGSTTTGQGGSKLLIDDPHSAMEAHSPAERLAAATWFRETWSNRMNDASKDVMLTIGQRIHEEDISGIIRRERLDWIHLNLPAEYESTNKCVTSIGWSDPRTEDGELLWPERFNQETLERYKRDLGSIGFAAQYQQRPVPAGGGQFRQEWIRYFTETDEAYLLEKASGTVSVLKSDCSLFSTVDLAISLKEENDYTVFGIWARTSENDLLLLDVVRVRISNPDQLKRLRLLHQQYPGIYFKIERVGYQLALIQQALVEGIPCKEYNPPHTKDKVARASSFAIWMENEKALFRKGAHYLIELIPELLMFPKAPHDDQVDVCAMAADEVTYPQPEGGMIMVPADEYEQDTGLGWF